MFFTYYIWFFLNQIFLKLRNKVNFFFVKYNRLFNFSKKGNLNSSFLEKIFFIFFKDVLFVKNKNELKNLIDFRNNYYPVISYYHLLSIKNEFNFNIFNNLIKQFIFFKNNKLYNFNNEFISVLFFKNKNYSIFFKYLIIQKLLYKKYFNLLNTLFYYNSNVTNLLKFNFLFNIFLLESKQKQLYFDLSKYEDWYIYHFSSSINKLFHNNLLIPAQLLLNKDFKSKKITQLLFLYKTYNFNYKKNIPIIIYNTRDFLKLNINKY
jgi:hypothetical protein